LGVRDLAGPTRERVVSDVERWWRVKVEGYNDWTFAESEAEQARRNGYEVVGPFVLETTKPPDDRRDVSDWENASPEVLDAIPLVHVPRGEFRGLSVGDSLGLAAWTVGGLVVWLVTGGRRP
jgi:hypothetical protein